MTHEETRALQHKASLSRSYMIRAWQCQPAETKWAIWIAGAVALLVVFAICWAVA